KAYGETRPIASNTDNEDKAFNRRVELTFFTASTMWNTIRQGDGGVVQTDGTTLYYSSQGFKSFALAAPLVTPPTAGGSSFVVPAETPFQVGEKVIVGRLLRTVTNITPIADGLQIEVDIPFPNPLPEHVLTATMAEARLALEVLPTVGGNLFEDPAKTVFDPKVQFVQPFVLNSVDPNCLLIGTNSVYESNDNGRTLLPLIDNPVTLDLNAGDFSPSPKANIGKVNSLVYGGRQPDGQVHADVIYVGTNPRTSSLAEKHALWVRQAGSNIFSPLVPVKSFTDYSKAAVRDVTIDPNDWRRIYVLDSYGQVWFSFDGAMNDTGAWNWEHLTGNLLSLPGAENLQQIVVENIDGTAVLLVGGEGGLFRRVGDGKWTEYGSGLPNSMVTVIERVGEADDLLLVGTLGRGAWTLPNVSNTLNVPGSVLLIGSEAKDVFYLVLNERQPWMLDVFQYQVGETKPDNPTLSVPFASVEFITISGKEENDLFIIDVSQGAIAVPGGITIAGGEGDTDELRIIHHSASTVISSTGIQSGADPGSGSHEMKITDGFGETGRQLVTWTGVESLFEPITVAQNVDTLREGIKDFALAAKEFLNESLRDAKIAGIDALSLAGALNGLRVEEVRSKDDPFVSVSQVGTDGTVQIDNATSFLLRLFEENGFDLSDVATEGAISSPDVLAQALRDILGATVDFDDTVDHDSDGLPDIFFEVEVLGKQLGGIVDLDVAADAPGGGRVELSGQIEITATIDLKLSFGVGAKGFFIEPNAPGDSELTIRNIIVDGEVSGSGRLGFIGLEVTDATLQLDPQAAVSLKLSDPGEGGADGIIRMTELDLENVGSLVSVDVVGDPGDETIGTVTPGVDDLVLTGTFGLQAIVPGFDITTDLLDFDLSIGWPNLAVVDEIKVSAGTEFGPWLEFLDLTAQNLVDQLKSLRDQFDALSQVSEVFGLDIPFVNNALDKILDAAEAMDRKLIDPLTSGVSGTVSLPTAQELVVLLASKLGIDLSSLGLSYSGGELTFDFNFTQQIAEFQDTIDFGFDMADGLADFDVSSAAKFTGDFGMNFTFGVDLGGLADGASLEDAFFIRDATVSGTAEFSLDDLDAMARFGFLGIEIVDGYAGTTSPITISLDLLDPKTNAADGRIDIGEIIDAISNGNPLSLVDTPEIAGSVEASLPLAAPFLGISASPDTTIKIIIDDIANPGALRIEPDPITDLPVLQEIFNFDNITAGGFVGILGKIANWLDALRTSSMFSSVGIPFTDATLGDVLGFAETISDAILFDEGGDDKKDGSDKLISDINSALGAAGLGSRMRAEPDGSKIKLIASDFSIESFRVKVSSSDSGGASELGFGTDLTSVIGAGGIASLTGGIAVSNGQLSSGDAVIEISIDNGQWVPVTVAQADTAENTGIGDDVPKLLFSDNTPTFDTVQELAARLAAILGIPLNYNAQEHTITFDIDILAALDDIDVPIDFDLDLAPFLELESDSVIRLSADAGLTLTIGIDLSEDLKSDNLLSTDPATDLSELNGGDGVDIKTNLALTAPEDVRSSLGRLSEDAEFELIINAGVPVTVTVDKTTTFGNITADDLADDINTALMAAGLGSLIEATGAGSRIKLSAFDTSVTAFELTASSSDPAVRDLGFGTSQTATLDGSVLGLTAKSDLRPKIGRFITDATFRVSLDGGSPVTVTVSGEDSLTNSNIYNVVTDINRALKKALEVAGLNGDELTADSLGRRLIFTAAPDISDFTITAAFGSIAATQLGLPTTAPANAGNTYDFLIQTLDGNIYNLSLDGLLDISHVISAISSATSGKVTTSLNDAKTGLKLTDNTTGASMFEVSPVNNSLAAFDLGIVGIHTTEDVNEDGVIDTKDGYGVIEGTQIAGPTLADRLFIENAVVNGNVSLTTPEGPSGDGDTDTFDGINASATFGGFVSIGLHGGGFLNAGIVAGLKDPDTGTIGGRITLTELFDGLSDIDSIVAMPTLSGGGEFRLGLSVDPDIPSLIGLGPNPEVSITVTNLENILDGELPVIELDYPDLGDLPKFGNIGFNFDTILMALQRLSDFLGQFQEFEFLNEPIPLLDMSINDMLDFADKLDAAIQDAKRNPAGTIQVLDTKLREAFGIPQNSPNFGLSLVPGAEIMKIHLGLDTGFSESIGVSIPGIDALQGGPVTLAGSADLAASGSVDIDLDLGIDLNDPTKVYLFDTTGFAGNLFAGGDDLTFRAALGPLGLFV
ncbi:MAG: hypothetical protein JRJ19_01880, partial [Deltaproteobacteria bacterium]|nr:hypothetical protein [Deltaproteobacteria bacterium]